jgi:outer membrane receptor protein involved in Fe transport
VGSQTPDYTYDYTNLAFGAEFRLGDTGWIGETWYTNQSLTVNIDGYELSRERLGLALEGRGGPSGDQWINPFGTRDSRHADFCDAPPGQTGPGGCIGTNNTQEMVDWVHVERDYDFSVEELQTVEGFVTGDVWELPAGNLAVAVGGQYRWNELTRRPSQAAAVGDAYSVSIVTPPDPGSRADQDIYAVFGEVFVPILSNLEATVAVRYEDFTDFGFDATVPKISVLYTPREWLSLRASWGEGFLAPTLEELTVLEVPECAEQFGGEDPIRGVPLAGAQSCLNGSEELQPEESEIFNVGFTIEPLEGLQISLDYQTVDYTDQIRQLSLIDTVEQDYALFLAANGLSDAQVQGLSEAERNGLAAGWAAANPDSRVIRSGSTGEVQQVNRDSVNIAEVNVDVWDLRANYSVSLGDYGYLTANWSTTHYSKYDYIDLTGVRTDALGKRNDDTDIVPVMPEFKHYGRLAWSYGSHLVSLVGKGYSDVDFDGTVGPAFGPGLGAEVPDEVNGQWMFNARYSYTFENLYGGVMELAVGANNVFDKDAQPLPVQGGLESRLQDPFGRMFYMELNYSLE